MEQQQGSYVSRRSTLKGSLMLGIAAALPSAMAQAAPAGKISATILAAKTGEPITKYMYGGFIEHLGNLINYSFWSEVLDDRKFYHAVNSQPLPAPRGPIGGMMMSRKWMPVGPDASVAMDTENPYVGEQSPVVRLSGSSRRGIQQSGLTLVKGKAYTGRVVLAADRGAKISATLIWGKGPGDRQTIDVPAQKDWSKAALAFTAHADTADGRIEIVGTGSGSFRVGAVSLMPADNVHGFRPDTVALMKEMNCGFLRLPGGNFVSGYDWKNTIGDPDKRPPVFDYAWNAVQPNDAGVDELLVMCELMGVDPYWCVDTGFGEPRSGGELVEYVNGAATTPKGALRAANGHPEPYRVKFWNIGNEMYGHWQLGHMSLDQYCIKHNLFAKAMRKADPSIVIIASGAMPDEMTVTQAMPVPGQVQVAFGSDRDWTGGLLKDSWGNFEILAEHAYPSDGKRFDLAKADYVPVDEPLVEWARRPANRVRLKAEAWEEYKKRFPALNDGKITVSLDEWAYRFPQDLKLDLAIAMLMNESFRHTDFLKMIAYTMGMSWLDYNRTDSVVSGSGVVFQLYNKHFGTIPVEVAGNSPVPAPQWPVGGDQPRVNAGSPTYPLDVSAALTSDRKALTVAVVNATDSAQQMDIDLAGFRPLAQGRMWRLTAPSLDAANRVGQTPQLAIAENAFDASAKTLSVAPYSIELYEFAAG
jgi:alpha-N-arabinofuranosidase